MLATTEIGFAVPNGTFRDTLPPGLTLNLYLSEVGENLERRLVEPWIERSADGLRAAHRRPPALIDCGYCITAWSASDAENRPELEEHQLLGEVLRVLLLHPRIPRGYWHEDLGEQFSPYPLLAAQPASAQSRAEFWTALGHPPKPALHYVVTVALPLHDSSDLAPAIGPTEAAIHVGVDHHEQRTA